MEISYALTSAYLSLGYWYAGYPDISKEFAEGLKLKTGFLDNHRPRL